VRQLERIPKTETMRQLFTSVALLMALLVFPGTCKKKKPEVPPQATAPTTSQPQQQPPPPATEQKPAEPETKPEEKSGDAKPPVKPKPKPRPSTTAKKPQPEMRRPTSPATATTTKPTTPPQPQPPASVEPGQLTASLSGTEAARRRQETAQLLAVTDGELKGITRALNRDEQNIVLQIKGYMQQSQAADKDGDLDRARNLAVKAKLLADDLAKTK